MMCYRDRQFCTFYLKCTHGDTCSCALTLEVLADADKWWGKPGAPIETMAVPPNCFHEVKSE
jgi:hypothetical protein